MEERNIRDNIDLYKNINVEEVNILIDNVTRSRYKGVNYEAISDLALKVLEIPPEKIQPNMNSNYQYPISRDETIKIVLDFFKSLDLDFYNKAQAIVNGEDKNVVLNFFEPYKSNDNEYESYKKNEASVDHTSNVKRLTYLYSEILKMYIIWFMKYHICLIYLKLLMYQELC